MELFRHLRSQGWSDMAEQHQCGERELHRRGDVLMTEPVKCPFLS
jgi:hypothetical protein